MGVLFMATADLQDIGVLDGYSSASISSTYARTGTYSFRLGGVGGYIRGGFASASEGYMKVALSTANTDIYGAYINISDATVSHLLITIIADSSTITVSRGATELSSVSLAGTSLNLGDWNVYEVHWVISDSVGVVQVKVNGVLKIDLSGQDTQHGGTAAATKGTVANGN